MKQFLALGIGVALLTSYLGYSGLNSNEENMSTDPAQAVEQEMPQVEKQEFQIAEDKKEINYSGVVGETALETLNSLAMVEVQESSFGEFVTSINGVEADSSTEYWAFFVNGELAAVGAGSYEAEEGDQITWRLESI